MATLIFFHAHPDDEAIFTGGTIALLTAAGHRVVVVYATSGELGLGGGPGLAALRRREAVAACTELDVARVVFLAHHDSGVSADVRDHPWGAFASVPAGQPARQLALIAIEERAEALVAYDATGVYGHPDHIQVHRVGRAAASLAGLPTWYEATIDREYLHFVETHVAFTAGRSLAPVEASPGVGTVTAEITTTVDIRPVLDRKHAAIAAHRSQIGDDPTFGSDNHFADVYGFEWFVRHGPPASIDAFHLASAPRRLSPQA